MPFTDSLEGYTHHDKDACNKCKICGDYLYIKAQNIAKATNTVLDQYKDTFQALADS